MEKIEALLLKVRLLFLILHIFGLPCGDKVAERFTRGELAGFKLRFSHKSSRLADLISGDLNNAAVFLK